MSKFISLNEEIVRQLSLMNFDRGLTLQEQVTPSDRLGKEGQFQPTKDIINNQNYWLNATPEQIANYVFKTIQNEINSISTDEEKIYYALKKLNFKAYLLLLKKVKKLGYTEIIPYTDDEKYVNYNSVIEWIQNEEFQAGEAGYEENKKWLKKYVDILIKFGDDPELMWSNFRKFEDATGTPAVGGGEWASDVEASDEQLASMAHIVLPLASIVVSVVFPPTWVALGAAALIELGDAALYLNVDDEPYAAGLAAIFAFVPFAQLKFLPAIYKLGKEGVIRFIKKLGLGKIDDLIKEERQLYSEMIENYERLSNMAKLNIAKKLTYLTLKSAKSAKDFIAFTQKLISKGVLNPESLGTTGLMIGGTFYTWDALAKQMDICNPSPLKMLTASDWTILRKVGEAGKYIQPFTTSCEVEAIIDKLNSVKTDNGLFTELLTQAKDKNYILSKKYSSSFSTDVLILQYILKKAGYEKSIKQPYYSIKESKEKTTVLINNASIIKKVDFYTSTGTLLKSVDNKENDTLTVGLPITKGVVIMKMSTIFGDEVRKFILGTGLSNKIYNTSSTVIEPDYGYFDSITEYLVKIYQKKNGLNSDGVVGEDTFNKLISDLKSKRYGTITNYDSFDFDKIRVDLIRKEYDKYVKEKDQLLLDDKKIEEAYKEHQSLVGQESKKISEGIKETNNLTDEEFEDIFGKYGPK